MTGSHRSKAVVATAIIGTAFIAALAFWLSFTALTHLAVRADIAEKQAWAWPLIVDGVIVVATVAVVALRGREGSRYAWALLAAGASVSVTANAIQAAWPAQKPLPAGLAAAICSVPPIVLLAITYLTVVLARNNQSRPDFDLQAANKSTAPNTLDLSRAPWRLPVIPSQPVDLAAGDETSAPSETQELSVGQASLAPDLGTAQANETHRAESSPKRKPSPKPGRPTAGNHDQARAEAVELAAQGIAKRQIAKRLGVSDTTISRWLKEGTN